MSSQGDQQGGGAGSWWGWGDSLLQTVKKQSETIISIYKEDLSEFTRTIKEDTLSVVKDVVKHDEGAGGSGSAGGAKRPAKAGGSGSGSGSSSSSSSGRSGVTTSSSGLNTFFDFMDSLKDEEEEEVLAKSRREKGVKKLQKDINTYTQEPADEEDFKEWKSSFNLEAHTVEISQLLSANNKMRAIHNELLPKLSYSVFWERYYYRFEKLLKDEERREKILMRAELDNKLDDWGGWEDDDSVEVSTEGAVTADADAVEEADSVEEKGEANEEGVGADSKDEGHSNDTTEEAVAEATVGEVSAAAVDNVPHDPVQPVPVEPSEVTLVEAVAPAQEEPAAAPAEAVDTPAQVEDKTVNLREEAAVVLEEAGGEEDDDDIVLEAAEDSTQAEPGLGDVDDDGWDAWE